MVADSNQTEALDFEDDKNPQRNFHRMGSKAEGPLT
jgi:hypothetical protein